MSFYEFVKMLKKINPNKIVFVKCGVFFSCIGADAIIAEKVLNLKRTCFSKQICKCGLPVLYIRNNIDKLEEKVKDTGYGIIIYDEMEGGEFEYKDKKYGVLWEHKGDCIIEEKRKCTNCLECKNNVYVKETCKYTLDREEYEKEKRETKIFIKKIEELIKK